MVRNGRQVMERPYRRGAERCGLVGHGRHGSDRHEDTGMSRR